jgi:ribosomal protein S18 acetylase RimI-like enzyme
MHRFDMEIKVLSVKRLELISEIINLHNIVWESSTGIIDLLKNSSRCYYVRQKGLLAGYAFIEEDRARGFAELQDLAVAPGFRGKGIGKSLIKAAMNHYSCLKLIARAENKPLIRLYKDLGFKEEYRIENYYEIGQDGLRMSWSVED